jgi:transposase
LVAPAAPGHARRNFAELESAFTEECRKVVESFSVICRVEAEAKATGLSAEQRLAAPQIQGQPVMEEFRAWLTDQIDGRKVEPNSSLGGAIAFVQKRWSATRQRPNPIRNSGCRETF